MFILLDDGKASLRNGDYMPKKTPAKTKATDIAAVTADDDSTADALCDLFDSVVEDRGKTAALYLSINTACRLGEVTGGIDINDQMSRGMSLMHAVKPTNELELIFASQMGAVHDMTMHAARQAKKADYMDNYLTYSNQVVKLSRVYMEQMAALQKMRGQGQQKIIVEKVNVESGGKAAIGINGGLPNA